MTGPHVAIPAAGRNPCGQRDRLSAGGNAGQIARRSMPALPHPPTQAGPGTPARDAAHALLADLGATARLAARAAALARPGDAILLDGPLGAGKSAFARAFLRAASGDPALEVPSPTFTLVQDYALPPGGAGSAHHFDLYRLDGPGDLGELGWDEARDGVVLVEWPERLGALAPSGALRVSLRFPAGAAGDGQARLARLRGWPDRLAALLAGLPATAAFPA